MVDLDELERLAKAATPGPWEVKTLPTNRDFHYAASSNIRSGMVCYGSAEDIAYIVESCNDMPGLIAENRTLRERVQWLEMRVEDYIEERDALVCTKYALERQKVKLAENLRRITPHISTKEWLEWSEQAAKEAGE